MEPRIPSQQSPSVGEDIKDLREAINGLDEQILEALNKRAGLSLEIGRLKSGSREEVFKPFREKDVLQRLQTVNQGPLPNEHLQAIYREILSSSRALQRPQRVVYLGPEGTFSYFAGLHALGRAADFQARDRLEDVFRSVRNREAELGIIPLENSLQGSVGQSLDLFQRYEVFIQAEVFCRISHALLTSARSFREIGVVYSHPQALQQCTIWLATHLPRAQVIPSQSTAAAAGGIKDKPGEAAIAHFDLAALLGLNVLASGIEDLPENWTRFLIIGPETPPPGNRDKTSLLFTLPDKPGSLSGVLELLAREKVNMKKLESRPYRGSKWEYVFFADVECDLNRLEYRGLMQELQMHCHSLRILGSYPNGPSIQKTAGEE